MKKMGMMNSTCDNMTSKMMMHTTFYWGNNAEFLFSSWPGDNKHGMYFFSLLLIFAFAFIVEWLSHSTSIKQVASDLLGGLLQTLMYTIRIALAYVVMLSVMSMNVGILLVAIGGHAAGYMLFGSRMFRNSTFYQSSDEKYSDLSPLTCC